MPVHRLCRPSSIIPYMSSYWKQIAGIILVSLLAFGPMIIYINVVHPKNPSFTIDHAYVTGFNLTPDGHLTSFFDIGLIANNTQNEKLKLVYRHIKVSIFKDKQNLGTYSFPGRFTQPKRNATVLRVLPVSNNLRLKKGPASDFRAESSMGYITFDVFMTAYMNGQNLQVNCEGVTATVDVMNILSTSFKMTQNSPNCGFYQFPCDIEAVWGPKRCY